MAAIEPDEAGLDHSIEEEEGGPSKTFLEHLEDLRWTLLKCVAVISVGFLLCLFAAPYLVQFLMRPLKQAELLQPQPPASVTLLVGTNRLGTFLLETNQPNIFGASNAVLELVPIDTGTNLLMGLRPVATNSGDLPVKRVDLINLGPAAAFFTAVKLAIYGGLALGSPFIFYFVGQFVFPALRKNEKKYSYWGVGVGSFLFLFGVAFCYYVLLPIALKAAVQYSEWLGFQANTWRAEEYIGFVSKCMLGMGVGFELPVVILVMVKIGVLDYAKLSGFRQYMIVVNLVIGAVLTPPDVISQVVMAVPLQILYEISVWIAWYWERQERKQRQNR